MSAEKLSPTPYSSVWLWNHFKRRKRRFRGLNLVVLNDEETFSLQNSDHSSSSSSEEEMDWLDKSLLQLEDSKSESDEKRNGTMYEEGSGNESDSNYSEIESEDSNLSEMEADSSNKMKTPESDDESSTCDESLIKVCDMKNGECVVFLHSRLNLTEIPLCLAFGNLIFTCLSGSITLNGYELKEGNSVNVSTGIGRFRCNSVLFKNCCPANVTEKSLKEKLKSAKIDREVIKEIMSSIEEECITDIVAIHMKKYESFPFMVLESLSDDVSMWENKWFQFDCLRSRMPTTISSLETELKDSLLSRINNDSIVIACGPKNIGKSSVLRWLINSVLNSGQKEIYFVDCDPGQCEFTTPGLLSFTFVDQPILMPPFVSLQLFKKKIFYSTSVGGINVNDNPDLYLVNFKQLWEQTVNFLDFAGRKPIFINTMGWMKDIGLQLLVDIIKTVRPTDVIELADVKGDAKKSYQELTSQNVREMNCWSTGCPALGEEDIDLNYNYIKLQLTKGRETKSSREAAINRNYSQLSYLSLCEESPFKPFKEMNPFRYKLSELFLHVVYECPIDKHLIVDILNNSWVHLCRVCDLIPEEEEGIHVLQELNENMCLGCGIVRQIDLNEGYIYILTPEIPERLHLVNCIVKPIGIFIPEQIVLT